MSDDTAYTLSNKHRKMPWGQTFFCVAYNLWLMDPLAITSFSVIQNFHGVRR